jgi:molecular chaperone GrpE
MTQMSKKSQEPKQDTPDIDPELNKDIDDAAEAGAEGDAESSDVQSFDELLNAEKEKYLRLYAEYDNYRKRSQKEREGLYNSVRADTILQILPVYDNLERALSHQTTDEAFYKGIEMTMTQLNGIFEKLGVKPIEAVGQKFDANLHNAVMHIEDDNYGENEIVEEFQKGFILGDKVIRFSMVKVAN